MSSSTSSSGGIGFVGLLTITFIVLKLTGVIAWEWGWVLAPLWISAGLTIVGLSIFGVVILVAFLVDGISDKRAARRRIAERANFRGRSIR